MFLPFEPEGLGPQALKEDNMERTFSYPELACNYTFRYINDSRYRNSSFYYVNFTSLNVVPGQEFTLFGISNDAPFSKTSLLLSLLTMSLLYFE